MLWIYVYIYTYIYVHIYMYAFDGITSTSLSEVDLVGLTYAKWPS